MRDAGCGKSATTTAGSQYRFPARDKAAGAC